MPHEVMIKLWHYGGHGCLKKSDDQYWYKSKNDTEWKAGLPPGMKVQDAARAFRSGE